MRTALEECISFHTVSLSTCRGRRAGFSVPPAGGGQEWGWALGQPAALLGRKEGAKIGRTIHQPPLAGVLLTPIPPQGSMAYIFWLMGPAGERNRATLEVASTAKAVGWGVQRAVSSVIEKHPSPGQLGDVCPLCWGYILPLGQIVGRKGQDHLGRRAKHTPITTPDPSPSTLQCTPTSTL